MKKLLVVLSLTVVLFLDVAAVAAQAPPSKGSTGPKTNKKSTVAPKVAATPQPLTIPKNAIANPNGSYSWTDPQGKKWLFVNTPFGIVKSEAPLDSGTPSSLAGAKAFDAGDKIRFEKPSPFGTVKWEKSKTDLTDEERKLVDNQLKAKQD